MPPTTEVMEDYKYLFKIVLVGDAGVGKTCLVRRFTQGLFPPGQAATIGVDFMIKTVEIEGEKIKLQIWDTAGQEKFRSITQSYYRAANALILVYDTCAQSTFDTLPQWMIDVESFAKHKVLLYLVGNKIDLLNSREIPTHIGQEWADRYEMKFLETSAKEADNVDKLFTEIAKELTEEEREKERDLQLYSRMSLTTEPTVKILNIRIPEKFVDIILKFEQEGFTID